MKVRTVTITLAENPDGTLAFALTPARDYETATFVPDIGHGGYPPARVLEYLADAMAAELDLGDYVADAEGWGEG